MPRLGVGGHLDDDVVAAPAGQGEQLGRRVGRRMVDDLGGALRGDQPATVLGARRAVHREPAGHRELHRCDAHTAARAVDQHQVARARLTTLEEGAIGGRIGHPQRRAGGEADGGGQRVDLLDPAERRLGVGARERARGVHAVAHRRAACAATPPGAAPPSAAPLPPAASPCAPPAPTASTTPAPSLPGV